jgi:hypothetical protein
MFFSASWRPAISHDTTPLTADPYGIRRRAYTIRTMGPRTRAVPHPSASPVWKSISVGCTRRWRGGRRDERAVNLISTQARPWQSSAPHPRKTGGPLCDSCPPLSTPSRARPRVPRPNYLDPPSRLPLTHRYQILMKAVHSMVPAPAPPLRDACAAGLGPRVSYRAGSRSSSCDARWDPR